MTVEEIIEIFKPWIYNDENQAGTQLEVIDASDLPMIADRIVKNCNIADVVGRSVSIDDIKSGKAHIDMRGSEKWGKKVERLRQILRIAAPKNLHPPAYSFAPFYYCKDGYWYESNWRENGSVPVLDIVD